MTQRERDGKREGVLSVSDKMIGGQILQEGRDRKERKKISPLFSINAAALFTIREDKKNPPKETPQSINQQLTACGGWGFRGMPAEVEGVGQEASGIMR